MIIEIKDVETFEKETAEGKVLVDFYATWCGPCKMLAPVLERIARAHEELKILEVDVDVVGELAAKYNIMSIPALIYFEDGKALDMRVGFMPEDSVLRFVKLK